MPQHWMVFGVWPRVLHEDKTSRLVAVCVVVVVVVAAAVVVAVAVVVVVVAGVQVVT